MKPVILGVAGLLLGLGGGTGAVMMKHKKLQAQIAELPETAVAHGEKSDHAPADSLAATDSAQAGESRDSTAVDVAAKAGLPSAALTPEKVSAAGDSGDTARGAARAEPESSAVKLAGRGDVRPATAPARLPDESQRAAGFKQLARIFGSMKAADAVKVMALMTDEEVEGVLRALGPKQAADMLGQFPEERAAALSRRLLVPTVKG